MFESLSDRLDGAFKVLQGNNKLTDINIAQSVREIRRALVAADVNYKIAKESLHSPLLGRDKTYLNMFYKANQYNQVVLDLC